MFMICRRKKGDVRRAGPASGAEAIPRWRQEMAFLSEKFRPPAFGGGIWWWPAPAGLKTQFLEPGVCRRHLAV
jgi:hypothetical protein